MRLKLPLLFLLWLPLFSISQNLTVNAPMPVNNQAPNRGCGSGLLPQQFEQWVQGLSVSNARLGQGQTQSVFNIPVIVHVIHNNEAVNNATATTGNNLNAAQILSQINILNLDFNGLNPDTNLIPNVFKPFLGKFQFNFCLAVVNPTGGILAEPGIDRINSVAKSWNSSPYSTTYIDATIKPNSIWDPNRYMNMWVCGITGGILGYATFPNPGTSGLSGLSPPYGTSTTDGLVMLNTAFGNIGTVPSIGAYNKGRTATHEIGHWLGLRHIWGDGTCLTDYCNDTPPAQTSNFGCPTFPYHLGTCTGNTTGEMTMNYMDYTDDACMYMFSKDQKVRAQLIMTNSGMRASLLTSTVCSLPTTTNEIGIMYVVSPTYSQVITCNSALNPTIVVFNYGSNTISTASYSYNIDGVNTQTMAWVGNLAPNSSLTISMPQIINLSNGVHNYNVGVYLPNGGTDPYMTNNVNNQIFSVTGSFTMTANSSGSICAGSNATLTALGTAGSYTWNPGGTTGTITVVSPTTTSIYTLSGSSGTCVNTRTVSVGVGGGLSLSVNSASICSGTSGTLTVSGATSYSWSTGSTNTSVVVTPTVTTVYTITGSNGTCNGSTNSTVTVLSVPSVSVNGSGSATLCAGQTFVMNGAGACTYTWMPGFLAGTSVTVTPSSSTIYTVVGTCNGCLGTATLSTTIQANPTVNIGASSTSLCSGASVTLTALGASTYSWSNNSLQNSIIVSPTVNTTYTLTGTTGNCSSNTVSTISVITPSVSVSNQTICGGSSTTLTAGGTTTYSWNTGATTSSLAVSPSVTTVYTVTGFISGCSNTRTVGVFVSPSLSLSINSLSLCGGNSGTLIATGATNFTWSTGSTSQSITVNPSVTTTYTVIGNSGSCLGTSAMVVTVATAPVITASVSPSNTVCSGMSIVFYPSGGACTYTYSTGSPTITPVSSGSYTIFGMSCLNGCIGSCVVNVNVQQPITLTLTSTSSSLCSGSSSTLSANGALSYSWSNGATGSSIVVSPSTSVSYSVTGAGSVCTSTGNISLLVTQSPVVSVNNQSICSGNNATLTANGATSYSWNTGSTAPSIIVSPTATTIYTVTGSNANCSNTKTVSVVVGGSGLAISVSANPSTICVGNSALLSGSGATTYSWSTGSTSSSISVSPTISSTYTLSGTSGACTGSTLITVLVNNPPALNITPFPSDTICLGKTLTLVALGNYSNFVWSSPGATSNTLMVTPSSNTVYTVTASGNTVSCIRSATIAITLASNPVSVVSSTHVGCGTTCNGKANAISSGGTAPYTFSISGSTCTSLPCSGLCAGLYTLTTTDAKGCNSFNIFSISSTVNNLLASISTTNSGCSTCANGALNAGISGGNAPYTYSWSPVSGTTSLLSNVVPGCYTVTIIDATNCSIKAVSCVGIATGVDELEALKAEVVIYPNPAQNQFSLFCNHSMFNYAMYSQLGQLVKSGTNQQNTVLVGTEDLAKGVYLIEIEISNLKIHKKLMID